MKTGFRKAVAFFLLVPVIACGTGAIGGGNGDDDVQYAALGARVMLVELGPLH